VENEMAGLRRICKMAGGMRFVDANGTATEYVWDYVADQPVLKQDMPEGSDRWNASEKKKYEDLKAELKNVVTS
jgi:hypothetical protein